MLSRFVRLVIVVMLVASATLWPLSQASAADFPTPQSAVVAWLKALVSGDRSLFIAVSSTYGKVGDFYHDAGTPLGFYFLQEMIKESMGDVHPEVYITLLQAMESQLPVLYVADNVAIVELNPFTKDGGWGIITVREDKDWKVSVLLDYVEVSIYQSFLP